jgi:hypothetical protein
MFRVSVYVVSFLLISFLSLFILLLQGISFKKLSYDNITIEELYLKYDKHLLLNVDDLKVLDQNNKAVVNINSILHLSYSGGFIKKLNISNKDLDLTGFLKIDPTKIVKSEKINFSIDDLSFIFEPNLPPLKAKTLYVEYKQDKVFLTFKEPTLGSINLDNSYANISNIVSKKDSILDITLNSKSLLQKELLDILEFYDINLPIYQLSGVNKINTNLIIPLGDDPIKVFTTVKSKDLQLKLDNIVVQIEQLNFELKNNQIELNSTISEQNKKLYITNTTNLNNKSSTGTVMINNFKYKNIIEIKNKKLNYTVDFKNDIVAKVNKNDLYYKLSNDEHQIKIDNLNKLINFSDLIDISGDKQASLTINSSDNFNTTYLNINDLDIKLNSFDNNSSNSKMLFSEIYCNLFNGSIKVDNHNMNYDTLNINLNRSNITTTLLNKESLITGDIDINSKKLNIKGDRLTDRFVNDLLNNKILDSGLLTLNLNGTFTNLQGELRFSKTTIQNVPILNNLISFINTTPAIINPILALPTLFRLGETSFDMQGYYVKSGWIDFNYSLKDKLLKLPNFYTNGKMMDFKGQGDIDLKTREVKTNIDVVFMKDHSKFLNHIPVVGYIITGDDGNFVTQVDITGSLDDPSYETHTVKNASKGAVNIIKRTLELPFKAMNTIFEDNRTKEDHMKYHKKVVDDIVNTVDN